MRVGDLGVFVGYQYALEGMKPHFFSGDFFVVAAVEKDGPMVCFPVDHWGRVYSWQGDTLFPEEVLSLSYAKIPARRLPPPYGDGDNDITIPDLQNRLPKFVQLGAAKYATKCIRCGKLSG